MQFMVLAFGHQLKIGLAIVKAVPVQVMDAKIIWAMGNLPVHVDSEDSGGRHFFAISITIIEGLF